MYDKFFCMNKEVSIIIHLSICLKGYTSITKQLQMRDFAASVYMWFTVIYFLSDLWRFIQQRKSMMESIFSYMYDGTEEF